MERSLEGAVVAVTGGARGIGRATSERLAELGARVAIGDLKVESASEAADPLGKQAVGLHLDVTDRDSFTEFLDSSESLFGPLDGLVNNAGVMIVGPVEQEDPGVTSAMIDVNLRGVITGTQLAVQRMKPRRRGRVINIASQAGKAGLPGGATYCATKAAVIAFSEAVRGELKGSGVGISWILPGVVDTELASGLPKIGLMDALEPEEIAAAVCAAMTEGGSEIWVPSLNQWLDGPVRLLPRGVRDRILALTGADKVLSDADPGTREGYERRVTGTS